MEISYEIRRTQSKKGRSLYSTRLIKQGEVIFSESPIASVQFAWNETCKYRACHHCLRSMETAEEMYRRLAGNPNFNLPRSDLCEVRQEEHVTCPQCGVNFCNVSCLQKSLNSYHKYLCTEGRENHPVSNLVEVWKTMHYPPETFNIMLIVRLIALIKQRENAEERRDLLEKLSIFCRSTKNEENEIVHKLLGDKFRHQIEVLRDMIKENFYEESLKEWYTTEGFQSLLALIGTNGQGIGTSSFSVWATNCDNKIVDEIEHEGLSKLIDKLYENLNEKSGAEFLDCEGSGLYVLQSSCNHSCSPNAQVTFPHNNHTLSLKALKDIQEGEEIFISYLDECDRTRSRHSRQRLLRENYLFICDCELCASQVNQPDLTSDEEDDDDDDDDHGCHSNDHGCHSNDRGCHSNDHDCCMEDD